MAKTKRRSSTTRTQIIRTPAPIVRVTAPRAAPVKRRRWFRQRAAQVGGIASQHNIDMALAGAAVGFAVKEGWIDKLPAIPVVGRIGAAAIALDYFSRHGGGPFARRGALACAVLAGYQLGNEGTIHGDDAGPDAPAEDGYGDDA